MLLKKRKTCSALSEYCTCCSLMVAHRGVGDGLWGDKLQIPPLVITQTLSWCALCSGMPLGPQSSPQLERLGSDRMRWQVMSGGFDQRSEVVRVFWDVDEHWQIFKKFYFQGIFRFADANSNSSLQFNFPSTKHRLAVLGFIFLFLPGFSLTSLKEQAMFPRAQLFEAHSCGHPEFFCSNSRRSDTVPTYISTMAGSWGPDHSRPTFCPQLSCLWQDRCMLCVLVLAANQGNPTVSPWWMLSTLPRPLCIPSMPVNSGALQYSRFRRCANHLKYKTVTQIPLLVSWTNPRNGSSALNL